jgi:DNA-binding GntR family transcriptional regulator
MKSKRVYDEILDRLLSGQWEPGYAFNRRQIAAELNVSVAPVLEAMLELEGEGLIETRPRKGTRVRALTLEDLQGQLIVREALECQAARMYCGEPIERHIKRLMRLAERIDDSQLRSIKHLKDEVRFHHYLLSLAGVTALVEAFERVMKSGLLYSIQVLHPWHESAPRASHVELVKGLTTRDPDVAEVLIREHVRSGKEALFEQTAGQGSEPGLPESPAWLRG